MKTLKIDEVLSLYRRLSEFCNSINEEVRCNGVSFKVKSTVKPMKNFNPKRNYMELTLHVIAEIDLEKLMPRLFNGIDVDYLKRNEILELARFSFKIECSKILMQVLREKTLPLFNAIIEMTNNSATRINPIENSELTSLNKTSTNSFSYALEEIRALTASEQSRAK